LPSKDRVYFLKKINNRYEKMKDFETFLVMALGYYEKRVTDDFSEVCLVYKKLPYNLK
jgi:hypothetical protein